MMPIYSPPTVVQSFRKWPLAASLLAVVIPFGVLVGWVFDLERFKRILPGLVAMNPLTALDFMLCGVALAILREETLPNEARLVARGAAVIVALTALLKLLDTVLHLDLRLDQFLFHEKLDSEPGSPNRMAPTTAFNFLLFGLALFLSDLKSPRAGWLAQTLALTVAGVASLASIGYLYGVKGLTGIASYIPMALHTSVVFIALASGLLGARPNRGWMTHITSSSTGGAMIRRMAILIIGAPLILGWIILSGQRSAFYNPEFAFSLVVISVIVVFSAVVWMNARTLDRNEEERMRSGERLRIAHDELEAQKEGERMRAREQLQIAHDELEGRVRERTEELSQALRQIGEGINVLGSSANGILNSSMNLTAGASNTAAALSETTATIEQVRQTARLSNEKAQLVAAAAKIGADISHAGGRATEEMRLGMARIREQMHSIAESMKELSEQTKAVSEIVAAVDEIASQSNLLAVNAAIEAARAGVDGKGFGVVAKEVKFLANQSKAATAQVRAILVEIQNAASTAEVRTQEGTRAVEAGVIQSGEASNAILTLAANVAQSAKSATEIVLSCEQELTGMDQVVLAMGNIKETSARNLDSAQHLEAAARVLDELGGKLREFSERRRI